METNYHSLCNACSVLRFALHDPSDCSDLGCHYNASKAPFTPFNRWRGGGRGDKNRHSEVVLHSESFQQLEASATLGCHLCTLLRCALNQSPGILSEPFRDRCLPGQVMVVLVEVIQEDVRPEQEIVVICDCRYSVLSVADVPLQEYGCSGLYVGTVWKLPPALEDSGFPALVEPLTKFYARCVRGKGPFLIGINGTAPKQGVEFFNGLPWLNNYMPGQIVNVYAEMAGIWLIGFTNGIAASIHQSDHPLFGLVDCDNFVKLMEPVHPGCTCGKGVWEPPLIGTIGGGQTSYINPDPGSDKVLSLIKVWLSNCVADHDACQTSLAREMPTRILDVGTLESPHCRLKIGLDPSEDYVTLSYRIAGIEFSHLPRTLQDAVTVTRKLGLRYLWIDSLCIIQDSAEDWGAESAKMGCVYANAYVNISAGCAANTEAGFLKMRNTLELRSCEHPNLVEGDGRPKAICPNIPRPDRILNSDILNTRGWILQERALSKRTIHFGPYEVYWECLVHSATEREPEDFRKSLASEQNQDSQGRREAWLTIRSGLHYIQDRSAEDILHVLGDDWLEESRQQEHETKWVLRNLAGKPKVVGRFHRLPGSDNEICHLVTLPETSTPEARHLLATHHLWYMLILDYSLRFLTKLTDRLPAVSGIAQIFNRSLGGEGYIAGLWVSDIINGLCWSRRVSDDEVIAPPIPKQKQDTSSYVAPSFSWAFLKAPVYFRPRRGELPVGMTSKSPYKATILKVHSTLASPDPFGKITNATLKVRSYILPYKVAAESHAGRPDGAIFDDPSRPQPLIEDDRLMCLAVRSEVLNSNNPSHSNGEDKDCLLIYPEDGNATPDHANPGKQLSSSCSNRYKRVGFVTFHVPMKRTGKSECPDCDMCKSGVFEMMSAYWEEKFGPKTEEEKAAKREEEERKLAAVGYAQWQLEDIILV